jgi:hypothetical protein
MSQARVRRALCAQRQDDANNMAIQYDYLALAETVCDHMEYLTF